MTRGTLLFLVLVAVGAAGLTLLGGRGASKPSMFADGITLEDAAARSQTSGTPVLAFFTADWCGPCQMMKRTTLADPEVTRAVEGRFIPVYVDMTRVNQGDSAVVALANKYGVRAFPTLIVLQGEEQVARMEGGLDVAGMTSWLATASR